MCETYSDELVDVPSVKTSTGIMDVCRHALLTGKCPSALDTSTPTFFEKYDVASEFGYVVPSKEFVEHMVTMGGKWLSVGSGRGFVESILIKHGIDVIATDLKSPSENPYFVNSFPISYCDIEIISAIDAITKYPDRHVIISWPCVDNPWAYDLIRNIKLGTKLVYIGEGINGCTADSAFHLYLNNNFLMIEEIPHIQFSEINDHIKIYIRKI